MVLRVGGLASGIDVDSIVKQMMTAKRVPLDKLNQAKTVMEWQRDNYRQLNSKLVDFRNNKLLKYDLSATMNSQKAVVSGNTSAVKAEANADASGIPMSVSVTKLAQKSTMPSTGSLKVDGATASLTDTLLKVKGGADSETDKYDLYINGTNFSFEKTDTISSVISTINASAAGVTATFDEISGKFSITAKNYGTDTKIDANDIKLTNKAGEAKTGSLISMLKLGAVEGASKAQVTVTNTDTKESKSYTPSSNSLLVNGVKLTFVGVTTAATGETDSDGKPVITDTPATIAIETNTDKALETITNFVQYYNELLNSLNAKVNEERYTDYPPLTDEQKEAMTDNDIELWEAKAKSGMLKGDSILKSSINSIRSILTSKLGDLSKIGITTGEYYENGKLYIDSDALQQALQTDPQSVTMIFQGNTSSEGLFDKLSSSLSGTLDKLAEKAGTSKYSADVSAAFKTESTMGKMLTDYEERIETLTDRLEVWENNYYKQFTAMETAISNYNSQSASLSSYFA
ncbi:flagellar filament capping protein FliD [Paenibacillus tengchongensis]|uniref:flagellar filament capping protein FliD n=1 Tax=Paenibacillus tengchongensis TaxID=2608684 RepID=UPI001FEC115E|nr:flagellar filament capping protein FliD [Paenibacillus tengchongensis]